ncbi:hypothetical protein LWI28_019987 [Acer negundo]|uniref:Cytochrome P450 n=1 Tax=Acer negundo TaxID=4023 RepID=A0AAD5NHK5_ACENE|nr:hypothetical protein LWI28_019987 [Acer negundo]KAK4835164.1 hypothetical protein QYF36_006104 [Acer negundo]
MDFLSDFSDLTFEFKPPLITILLVTLITLVFGFFRIKFSPLPGKKLPPGSFGFPLLGESVSFVRAQKQDRTDEWMQTRIDKYGPVFKTSLSGSKMAILTGQAGNRFVFSGGDNGISYNQPGNVAKILGKYSLFETSGPKHKLIRGAVSNFLKPESIQRYVEEMDSLVQKQLFKELAGKDSVKIVTLMKKITFNVSCSIFFGLPDGKVKDQLLEDFSTTVKGTLALPLNFPGTVLHRAIQARGKVCKVLSNLITIRKKEMEEGIVDSQDNIISSLLVLRNENGEPLMEQEILDIFLSLIMASHYTTTVLLSHLVRLMSRDSEIYNKVLADNPILDGKGGPVLTVVEFLTEQKEVVEAKKGSDGKLTWNEIQMMKYTWRVAQELMRFTPPISGNFRLVTRDIHFDGFHIPKGWQLFWVASGTHKNKNIFEDPNKFDPSRFETSSKAAFPPYTYIPFGAGPRICPGAEFVRVETLLLIHHLITKYQWTELIPDEPVTHEPMPYPAMGLPVKLHTRNEI